MCGIAGYIGNNEISGEKVSLCLELMRRRGPDAKGVYRHTVAEGERHVCLLHSRLAIIDLDAEANQPFRASTDVLVFNGELYNYLELRAQLQREGQVFHTASDTEVLLKALVTKQSEGLKRCEGMWAFAWYNEQTGALLLGRDRFGEKPLYVYRDADGLYFGSEIKFIRALSGTALPVNVPHLYRYLVNGYKSLYKSRETFFSGIYELPAASVLRIDRDGLENQTRYWQPSFQQDQGMSYEAAVEGTRQALINSVSLRLRADVPIAFCMSGGVDSNSLIAIAKKCLGYDVHGFTIVNTDARYEEQEMLEYSVRELGLRHTPVTLDSDNFLEGLRKLVIQHDAPVYTISYYVHWLLMKAVNQAGYRISVSGTAADELFSGYYDHHNAYLATIRDDSSLYSISLENWAKHVRPIVRNPYLQNPDIFTQDPDFRRHIYLDAEKFSGYLKQPWGEAFQEEYYSNDLMRNRMANELFFESVPVILHEDDLNSMYYSIENRSPFLDTALFEFSARIPTRHLIREGRAKAVLRDAMRGIVPEAVLCNHRKVGFNAPILDLLDTQNSHVRKTILVDSPIFEHVQKEKIENLLGKKQLPNSESKFLFYFLCAKYFLEEYSI